MTTLGLRTDFKLFLGFIRPPPPLYKHIMICKGWQGNLAYGNFPTPHARREVRGGRDAADFLGRQIGGGECGKFSFLFFYILFMGLDIESIRRG